MVLIANPIYDVVFKFLLEDLDFENEIENKDKKLIDFVIKLVSKDIELKNKEKELEIERQKAEYMKFKIAKFIKIDDISIEIISKLKGLYSRN